MDFAKRQADPRRHLTGIAFVILFHAFIVYALLTGLATKVVEVVRAPIETKVIEELKKPPPPPEVVVPPPPRLEAPPPPYIPPPEVQIATPPPVQSAITAVTQAPPPAPVAMTPVPPPPVPAAPPPPRPAPGPIAAGVVCSKMPPPELPGVNYSGTASMVARAAIKDGRISGVEVLPGSVRGVSDRKVLRAFVGAIEAAMRDYVCAGDNIVVQQEFVFKIE